MNTLSKVIQELENAEQNKSGMFELGEETMCALMDLLTKEREAAVPIFEVEISGEHWINACPAKGVDFRILPDGINTLYAAPPAQPVAVPTINRSAIVNKVQGLCSRLPGATFANAAEFAIEEIAAITQPVAVPDELLSAMEEVLRISDRDHEAWHRVRDGIASCRAAMLNQAPVKQPASNEGQP